MNALKSCKFIGETSPPKIDIFQKISKFRTSSTSKSNYVHWFQSPNYSNHHEFNLHDIKPRYLESKLSIHPIKAFSSWNYFNKWRIWSCWNYFNTSLDSQQWPKPYSRCPGCQILHRTVHFVFMGMCVSEEKCDSLCLKWRHQNFFCFLADSFYSTFKKMKDRCVTAVSRLTKKSAVSPLDGEWFNCQNQVWLILYFYRYYLSKVRNL